MNGTDEYNVKLGPASWLWVRREGGRAWVGLTEEAADACGMILFVELPEEGDHILRGGPFMLLETAVNELELPAPVSGMVREVNRSYEQNPGLLHQLPPERNWLMIVEEAGEEEGGTGRPSV